jgi:hypothetical protein
MRPPRHQHVREHRLTGRGAEMVEQALSRPEPGILRRILRHAKTIAIALVVLLVVY